MNSLLRDLYSHQAWADAEHWRAIQCNPAASQDKVIFEKLHHIHLVQHAYLRIVSAKGAGFKPTKPEDFPGVNDLKNYARNFHNQILPFLDALKNEDLNNKIIIPWAPTPPVDITVEQALMQVIMHSHYHRAQNATRLRELGGEPPPTDFVQWLWTGRPKPDWGGDKS